MKFSFKVFLAIFSIAAAILASSEILILRSISSQTEADYVKRYQNLSQRIGDTLIELDRTTELVMLNALRVVRERERARGLPSNADLKALANELGVSVLYVTDAQGRFVRSSWYVDIANDPELQAYYKGRKPLAATLFSYCDDYKELLTGRLSMERTPMVPTGSGRWKSKFLMIPNHDRTRVLDADMEMGFIGKTLDNALRTESDVDSIDLFSPNGEVLGSVHSNGGRPLATADFDVRSVPFSHPAISPAGFVFFTKVAPTAADCCECRTKGLTSPDGSYYYILRTVVSRRTLDGRLARIRDWFLNIGLVALILSGFVAYFVSRRLVERLTWMGARARKIAESNDLSLRLRLPGRDEVALLAQEFDGMLERLKVSQAQLADAAKEKALVELARQVAHDIRSPLVALETVLGDVSKLPESHRTIIRGAAGRIRDIANHLLNRNGATAAESEEPAAVCLLSALLDGLLTEKRLQYRSRADVEIEGRRDAASYGLFARVQPVEFKRLASNLINNAVEAIDGAGKVSVSLIPEDETLRLEVADTGKGIPAELLSKLGERGRTHGKTGGSGLGLHHARAAVESWGGSLELRSETGRGTTVVVSLPKARPPEWFVSALELAPSQTVVVIDDDASIHQVWQARFDAAGARERGVEILHFLTPDELRAWVKADAARAGNAIYLADYELSGRDTGLALLAELGIGERSILVTSRSEEKPILEECLRLKVRMIPKSLANLTPIRISEAPAPPAGAGLESWDAVLIDDDPLTRMTWKLAADRSGKRLRAFATAAEFQDASSGIGRGTPIYIDVELGGGANGVKESERIRELGFEKIYLATGHSASSFAGLKHLRGIVGKEPPWAGAAG